MADVGEFVATLKIVLEGNGLKEASAQMEQTQSKAGALDAIMSRFVFTLGDVMNVGSKLAKGLWSLAQAAGDSELQTKRLADAMKAQGIYTDAALEANLAYATSLQKITKYDDEAIVATMQLLTTFGLHDEQLRKTTELTAELASGLGVDLRSAAMLLGKAFAGETSTLSRYGIIIDESIPKSERFAEAMRLIQQRFGGAAAGEAQTFLGKVEQLKNSFDDLKEKIGGHVIPVFDYWMKKISGVITLLDKLAGVEKEVNTGKTWQNKLDLLEEERRRVVQSISVYEKYEDKLQGIQKQNQDALHARLAAIDKTIVGVKKGAAEEERIAKNLAADINKISVSETQNEKSAAADRLAIRKKELEGRERAESQTANDIKNIRVKSDADMKMSFEMAMNAMIISYQSFGSMFTTFWQGIHGAVQAGFVSLITNLQNGLSSFSEAAGVVWEGMKSVFINMIAEMATQWVMKHVIMKAVTLAWKGIEIGAAAAVAAARAAAASAWSLWGAIAIGASIGLAVKAFGNKFAKGVRNFAGGPALVGEEGPEIVNLPRGSSVYTNRESTAMLAGAGGGSFVFNITMHGSSRKYADEVADQIVRKVNQNRKW